MVIMCMGYTCICEETIIPLIVILLQLACLESRRSDLVRRPTEPCRQTSGNGLPVLSYW